VQSGFRVEELEGLGLRKLGMSGVRCSFQTTGCYKVLQRAVYCSMLQCVAVCRSISAVES